MYDRMYNTSDETLPVPEQLLKTAMEVRSAIDEAIVEHEAGAPVRSALIRPMRALARADTMQCADHGWDFPALDGY